MAVYAIGDVHGCLEELRTLLARMDFRAGRDRLWFVGDIINRGPDSLGVLRFVRDLGGSAITLMGNHEARALIGLSGHGDAAFTAQMGYLTQAPDVREIHAWLRGLPFLYQDDTLDALMVHAGLYPGWSLADAVDRAQRLHEILLDDEAIGSFFAGFTDVFPETEPEVTDPLARLRFAFLVLTRIRLSNENGRLLWSNPGPAAGPCQQQQGATWRAWHELGRWPGRKTVVYGHWAAAGLTLRERFYGLDSGCVYGGKLSAIRLDHPERPLIQVPCPCYVPPDSA
ncbi:MAG: symmetrical bis(5'-nucleosyl)-tetraphosphatase [Magnetococcales bacterium]|nr:symmetrical bis(5'-nucleosyl)-tetraphosphatase [Magnetococcales bacterium]